MIRVSYPSLVVAAGWMRWTSWLQRPVTRRPLTAPWRPREQDGLSSSGDGRARWGLALAVEGLDGLMDGGVEGVGVAEGPVGEVVALQVAPGALDVVQLGRVLRQPLDREPGPLGERLPARLA